MPDTWQLGVGEERARIAVVGCGGSGCNTLRRVAVPANAIRIAVNDAIHPAMAEATYRLVLPSGSLQAYASMDEKAVRKMETHEEKEISAALLDRDAVLILGGLGGELGGWGMSLVGRVARILGDATIALATIPFSAEGAVRRQLAEVQLQLLQKRADAVVTFSNDRLLDIARDLPLARAFAALGAIMAKPVSGLGSVLTRPDVVPVKRMLARARDWRFGMGSGRDKHRCFLAVEEAYASPWFASLPEDVGHAVVLMAPLEPGEDEAEILREIRLRSPRAVVAWGVLPREPAADRVTVQILAGT